MNGAVHGVIKAITAGEAIALYFLGEISKKNALEKIRNELVDDEYGQTPEDALADFQILLRHDVDSMLRRLVVGVKLYLYTGDLPHYILVGVAQSIGISTDALYPIPAVQIAANTTEVMVCLGHSGPWSLIWEAETLPGVFG